MKIFNRRARRDYYISETFEAGAVLFGHEAKSIRQGRGDLSGSFVRIKAGEAWLVGANIPQYGYSTASGYDPLRTRKLLLHKREILSLYSKSQAQNLTFVPISLYNKGRL